MKAKAVEGTPCAGKRSCTRKSFIVGSSAFAACGCLFVVFAAHADAHPPVAEVSIPNAQFSNGHDGRPEGWRLSQKDGGDWLQNAGRDGSAALRVTGKGDSWRQWQSDPVKLEAGRCYVFSFWNRGNGSGCITSGIDDMNVDWGCAGEQWTKRLNVLRTPDRDGAYAPTFHLGQWMMDGEALFDDLRLVPVQPVYVKTADLELGHGEQVDGNRYSFATQNGAVSRNHARPLVEGSASFNSDRWDVGRGRCITYRFALPKRTWKSAKVGVTCGHYTKGTADIEISHDGKDWTRLAAVTNTMTVELDMPTTFFPADAIFVRVRGNDPCQLQIYRVSFDGAFAGAPVTAVGATKYVDENSGEVVCKTSGCTFFTDEYGEMLPMGRGGVQFWRASSGWKIPRQRALPKAKAEGLSLMMAANEAEAVQLVVSPKEALEDVRVEAVGPLVCRSTGREMSSSAVEVLRVGYVPVDVPTDEVGCRALWPDPLPPQDGSPLMVAVGEHQPFWVRVKAPKGTSKGDYAGSLRVVCTKAKSREKMTFSVPLTVEVFGFELPDEMTCETAFDFSLWTVSRYHGLKTAEERKIVAEKYLRSLGDHHISPYDPGLGVNWSVKWKGMENPMTAEPVFDWAAWDKAVEEALSKYHFNTFLIRVKGLGGGNYQKWSQPEFMGIPADNPAYDVLIGKYLRGIERHLEEKGWLGKAFLYVFDEPEPKHYPIVMRIFETVKRHAPKLRRMVTEEAVEALHGGPNLWVPLTPNLHVSGEKKARAAGDTFWWYVCCGPKAPYVTEFIDHPGTEMRLWLWQTWGEDVAGILIWTTTWWTCANAYPDPAHPQNPYEDAMSWCESDSLGKGTKSPWGNGDGRFLYPPRKAAQPSPTPVFDGPVDSFRLEMLRDGIEDYEYFALLKRLLAERRNLPPDVRAKAAALLKVPSSVYSSMTEFTRDPKPMETHREKLARAIENILSI